MAATSPWAARSGSSAPAAALRLPAGNAFHRLRQPRLELAEVFLDLLARRGGKLVEGLGRHHLAILHRRERETGGRADEGQSLGLRGLLDQLEGGFLLLLELLVDGLLAGAEFFALEECRDRREDVGDEAFHAGAQPDRAARRQAQRPGCVGAGEIVDVNPIVGRGRPPCVPLQQA